MNKLFIFLLIFCSLPAVLAQNNSAKTVSPRKPSTASLDSINRLLMERPLSGSSRQGKNPVLFLIGNSTMRQGTRGNGDIGQWGWGFYAGDFFDTDKITVENHALGGTSSRSFYRDLWKDVLKGIKKGDWVFIEMGHNDNGSYDNGRASIKGIGQESAEVMVKQTLKRGEKRTKPLKDKKETVYSFGGYLRRYIAEIRAKGANPALLSITPRNSWTDEGNIVRADRSFGLWAKQISEEQGVPFIDLNDISAHKYEKFGKAKTDYMFYGDNIHTSAFGARENALSAIEGIRTNTDLKFLASCLKTVDGVTRTGERRQAGKPVVFTIGDSTVKNQDKDSAGMWGWGSILQSYFDSGKALVDNQAIAGRSARTYLDEGRWERVYAALQPGDIVLIQFGHNDGGSINMPPARGELHGAGDSARIVQMPNRRNQVIYTYGWYIRKFAGDAIEKGAIPIVLSHTPRNRWTEDGKIIRNASTYGAWAKEAAGNVGAYFIDLNEISAAKLEKKGMEGAAGYFKKDHTHTSLKGAHLNAQSIVKGIRQLPDSRIKSLLINGK